MPHRKARTADIEQRLLIDAIYHRYHYDFRGYAQASLKRRLASALVQFDCKTLSQLQDRVLHEPAVFPALLEYLTVQVSDMFRDPSYFQALRQEVVPLLRTYPSLKVWVAGCSAGEELYSLAILFREEGLEELRQPRVGDALAAIDHPDARGAIVGVDPHQIGRAHV